MLSDKAIKEYKDIFKKEFDQDLTDGEAREQSERLIQFFKTLIKIDQQTSKGKNLTLRINES